MFRSSPAVQLCRASEDGKLNKVQSLLAAGTPVDSKRADNGTALMSAAFKGHLACLKALLEAGAQADSQDDDGWTALIYAATGGHVASLEALLAAGAQLDAKDKLGATALMYAAGQGKIDVLKALLAAGAQVDARSDRERTALMHAAEHGRFDCLQALLASGAQPDARDDCAKTALMHATAYGNFECIEALIAAGAQVDAKDKYGKTAYSYAPKSFSRLAMQSLNPARVLRGTGSALATPQASGSADAQSPPAPAASSGLSPVSTSVAPRAAAAAAPTTPRIASLTHELSRASLDAAPATVAAPTTTAPAAAAPAPAVTASPLQNSCAIPYEAVERGALIGEGSFGKVYAATWQHTPVAIKEFPPAASALSLTHDALFLREVELLTKVNHAHVLRFYGYCPEPLCIVTELCDRGALVDVLEQARGDEEVAKELTWPRRLGFALDAAKGMAYLHSLQPKILHRDLKSPNLLVTELWGVKVADLGLSEVANNVVGSIAKGLSLGADNPRWMAPEVLRSKRAASAASDVFAFGVVMWELLSWQLPWTHLGGDATTTAITLEVACGERPPVPTSFPGSELHGPPGPWLQRYTALMQRCWAQAAADRPSFAEVVAELAQIRNEVQPNEVRPAPPPPAAPNPAAASLECCICQERPPNAALLHRADKTQHRVCCMQCAEDLMARGLPCPICRRPIDDVFTSFG